MATTANTSRVIAYTRVSTDEQGASGLGLADQRAKLEAEAERRGWSVVCLLEDDGYSAKTLDRPGVAEALRMLADGEADVLAVAKLDRLSRSVADFAGLADRAQREGWTLTVLDVGVDTATPSGGLMANVVASFAQYERALIGQRTRDALAVRARQGVRLGRPVTLPGEVRGRIAAERAQGASLRAIADTLTAEGVPTAQGGARWHASTVRAVLRSAERDAAAATARKAAA